MVIYKFDGVLEHEVLVRSHGNSKDDKCKYRRAMESTKKELRKNIAEGKSKEVVDELYIKRGGILKAQSSRQLPCERQQAYNIKKRLSTSGSYLSAPVFATNAT